MDKNNIVYSTDPDWKKEPEKKDGYTSGLVTGQTAYIQRDRKKRAGKVVTVISGLKGDLKGLQKELQKLCGSGGTVKNDNMEIQGDHREKIADYLQSKGFKTKFVSG
jgi:translation initiation factor 1